MLIDPIMEHLDVSNMLSMSQVCREWRDRLDGNGCLFWALKSKQRWPELPQPRLTSSTLFKSIKHFVLVKSFVLDLQYRFKRFVRGLNLSPEQLAELGLSLDPGVPITQ